MNSFYLKNICKVSLLVIVTLFCLSADAATVPGLLMRAPAMVQDTSIFKKPGRLRKAQKIKNEEKEQEDGVDNDIRAREQQEFSKIKDPKLNRVPLERLLVARQMRDQFLKARKPNSQLNLKQNAGKAPLLPTSPFSISSVQWTERGPTNVGGRTRALLFDAGDVTNGYKKVFAGGVGGGLWRTSDITATPVQWSKINDFFDNIAISCIAQDPVSPQVIYAGTGEGFFNADAIQGLGVWKSTDGGATWAHLTSTVNFSFVNAILVDKNHSVYIAGESATGGYGIEQSINGGTAWTQVTGSGAPGADLQLAANGDVYASTGIIGSSGHIYVSDFGVNGANTGKTGTWTNITPNTTGVITPATNSWFRIKLATAPGDANIVYAFFEPYDATYRNTSLSSVQQYDRSTNSWTVKKVPPTSFANGQSWYSIAAAVDPNNSNVLYAGSLDGSKSVDGGTTWSHDTQWSANTTSPQYVHADHHAYVYAPGSSSRLLMGTDGGLFYSVNAGGTPSFVNKNNGYDVTQFYSVALHPTNYNYALAGAQDNGTQEFSASGLGTTSVATGGDGGFSFIDQLNGNIQISSYVYDQYYLSTNNGVSFNGLQGYGTGSFINPTDYDSKQKNIYAGSTGGQYYRAVNVLSPAYSLVTVAGFNNQGVTAVTVAPITANRVYFGLSNGTVALVDNAQTGTNNTSVILSPNPGVSATVSCVAVDPATENHILVTYSNYGVTHIFETKNASAATPTWTSVGGNLPDMPVRWALFYPGEATKAVIATELGVWSTDALNGTSTVWDPTNSGLANVEVDMLKYRAADGTLAAATHGRGIFTTVLPTNNTNLSNLAVSSGTLTPAFASSITKFTDAVANSVSSITVTPTAVDSHATILVNNTAVASGTASSALPLKVGANTVLIMVESSDGSATRTDTLTVNRALSNNAALSNLSASVGAFTPVFAAGTKSYTESVPNSTQATTVTATTADPNATVAINGIAVTSGSPSAAIPLIVGKNTIQVVVTAQDGTTKGTYAIVITRAASSNASLANLQISSGTLSPKFTTQTTAYTASVSNAISSITVTPTLADANATVTVNGAAVTTGIPSSPVALNGGPNTINVVVTAQDGVTQITYTLTITRALSGNDNLSALSIHQVAISPTFLSHTTSYTAAVPNATSSIVITATATEPHATIKINGVTTASGAASSPVALNAGDNTITVAVTSQNGVNTLDYVITVNRKPSTNDALTSLQLKPFESLVKTTGPDFADYTVSVPNNISSISVIATASDPTAVITVNGTVATSGTASAPVALAAGSNTITTTVTAQDGVTTRNYVITITRAPSSNAILSKLSTSPVVTLTSVTGPGYKNYTGSVPNTTATIKILPVVEDATATIQVNGVAVASGSASKSIALTVGSNTITTVVTAQDGVTTNSYIMTITRAAGPVNIPDETVSVDRPEASPLFAEDGINVHQGVSPNGDGINDVLKIDGITEYPENTLTIMNRNGSVIYEAKGYDNQNKVFDGHSNKTGQMQLPGTYFFSLEYTVKGVSKHKTGYLVLKY